MSDFDKEQEFNLKNQSFERKLTLNGKENPKYIDLLEEDRPITGQHFACVSFISPEKIIKSKDIFYFEQYLKQWDMSKSMDKFTQFLNFLSAKYNLKFDSLTADLQEFCKEEKDKLFLTTLEDDYKTFLDKSETKLEEEFNKTYNFQTSVRGIKIRGSFPSQHEAELRCKMLREGDPNHDVFVGPVGTWIPFHPEAYKTGRVEYMEETLNQLMSEKNTNEQYAKSEFDKYVRENKEKAVLENKRRAAENQASATQEIDAAGNLVSAEGSNTVEAALSESSTVQDIRRELFEGDNIVIDHKPTTTF
jgi:hypothetical protein